MRLQTVFQPKLILSRDDVRRGLRALTWEGITSTGFSSVTTSTFLVAFALALGANNFQIGILASLPFITDLLQIPAVWLVEKLRRRKAIVLIPWLVSQLLWVPVALIPVITDIPGGGAVSVLLGLMAVRGIINAFTNCGWNSWVRDLVPQNILGRYLARRESLATALAVVLGLGAGYFLDNWNMAGSGAIGYSFVLLIGLVFFGLASPALMAFIPEPVMPPVTGPRPSFTRTITMPLRERNYRHFMKFLTFWGFASNMAVPFFAVFMLRQLGLPVFTVIALTMVSEVFTVISLRFWGPLADRFGSKVVLYLSTSLFLLTLVGWLATAVAGRDALMLPLLGILHVFVGIAVAGITLTVGTLSFKLAPPGRATPYLAGASLAESAGTGLGALAAGFLADVLTGHTFALDLSWAGLNSIRMTGYHVLFTLAFIIGLVTLRTLHAVSEKGCVRQGIVLPVLLGDITARFHRLNTNLDMAFSRIFPFGFFWGAPVAGEAIDITAVRLDKPDGRDALIVPASLRRLEKKPPPVGGGMVVVPVCF